MPGRPTTIIAVISISDAQVIAAAIALYGVAVALLGSIIRYLKDEIIRLNTKIEEMEKVMQQLNAESRELARAALIALDNINTNRGRW